MQSIRQGDNHYLIKGGKFFFNGEEIDLPKGINLNSSSISENRVFIGGCQFDIDRKEFKPQKRKIKKSLLKMLWHKVFK